MQRWLLDVTDRVIVRAAAAAAGTEQLEELVRFFKAEGNIGKAARIEWSISMVLGESSRYGNAVHEDAALTLLEQLGDSKEQSLQQNHFDILTDRIYALRGDDRVRAITRIEALLASNPTLKVDENVVAWTQHWPRCTVFLSVQPSDWDRNNGFSLTVSVCVMHTSCRR